MASVDVSVQQPHTPAPLVDYSAYGPDSVPPLASTVNPVVVNPDARPLPMPALNSSLQQHMLANQNQSHNVSATAAHNRPTANASANSVSANHSVYVIALPPTANVAGGAVSVASAGAPPLRPTTAANASLVYTANATAAADEAPTVIDLNQSTNGPQHLPIPIHEAALQQMHLLPVTTTHSELQVKLQMDQLRIAEAEARLERDAAVKERRELERRLALVDVGRVEEAKLETRMAKVTMRRQEEAFSTELQDMARKVAWYVDNQSFSKAQEDLIKEQQDTIHTLRLRFQELESLVTKAGVVRTDKDAQIRALQRRNFELEETIRDRYPNSIPELIRACQPANTAHSAEAKALRGRIAVLEEQLAERDGNYERGMALLRTEADQLRLHYQERITTMEEEMKLRIATAQTKRVRELEKQLAETRRYYGDKLKETEAIVSSLRRGGASGGGTSSFAGGAAAATRASIMKRRAHSHHEDPSASDRRGGEGVAVSTQTTIGGGVVSEQKYKRLLSQYRNATDGGDVADDAASFEDDVEEGIYGEGSSGTGRARRGNGNSATTTCAAVREALLKKELSELRTLISSGLLTPDSANAQQGQAQALGLGTAPPIAIPPGGSSVLSLLQRQLHALQTEAALHKRLLMEAQEASRRAAVEAEDRIAALRQQHRKALAVAEEERADELRRVKRLHLHELQEAVAGGGGINGVGVGSSSSGGDNSSSLLTDITAATASKANVAKGQKGGPHHKGLSAATKGCTPAVSFDAATAAAAGASSGAATAYLELVTERLQALEHRQRLKELQAAKEVAEIRRLCEIEIQAERQKRALQVEEKNREIVRFRGQLDQLLGDLNALRGIRV